VRHACEVLTRPGRNHIGVVRRILSRSVHIFYPRECATPNGCLRRYFPASACHARLPISVSPQHLFMHFPSNLIVAEPPLITLNNILGYFPR
jgi:hypothetical protein